MDNQASTVEAIFSGKQAQKRRKLDFVPSKQSTPFHVTKPNASNPQKESASFDTSEPFKPRPRNSNVAPVEKSPTDPTRYLEWAAAKKIGPGFYNEGNSCYLNSTLQCLMYLPPLVQLLLKENILQLSASSSALTPTNTPPRLVVELFRALVKEVHCPSPPKALSPRGMVASIRRVGRQFKPLRQVRLYMHSKYYVRCIYMLVKGTIIIDSPCDAGDLTHRGQ